MDRVTKSPHKITPAIQSFRYTHNAFTLNRAITYQENLKRPTGGGQKGLEFGSERPAPAGITSALSFGQICTL
jgi:hypothetical protein